MLRILTGQSTAFCDRLPRRDFLRVGGLGLAGLTLADMLRCSASANPGTGGYDREKSVVLLFLGGGPSQYETFDPKPEGPGSSTSIAGHLATRIPGVRFATYFPQMAELADRLTVVRNFQTNHAEHNGAHKQILTADLSVQDGKPIRQPGLGPIYARAIGATDPATGLPTQALIPPTTRHLGKAAGFAGAYESVVEGCQPAGLGPAYTPLEVYAPMAEGSAPPKKDRKDEDRSGAPPIIDDLTPRLPDSVIDGRLNLLRALDRLDRRLDATGAMEGLDEFSEQAINVLRGGGVRRALDLSLEDLAVLAAYDTEHFRNYRCGDDSKFERGGPSIGISLGRQLLLARRLCEAGCRFVTVIHANWDFHARKGIPNIPEGMSVLAPPLDHAVAAFLRDLQARGLDEKILLVVTGEFGRTTSLDENLGRHHWPRICPLLFAGGGLRHGQVVGQSDRRGGEPEGEAMNIDDLHATVLHALLDMGKLRLDPSIPRSVLDRAGRGRPLRELFG